MSGREGQELEGVTLLGNQGTKYPSDYAPDILETFLNKHPDNDYFVKFKIVRNLLLYARLPDSRTLLRFIFRMCRTR